jgi:O-antigen/teichoic acid export membrane protein
VSDVSVKTVGKDLLLYVPGRVIPAVMQILTVTVLTFYFSKEEIGRYDLTFRFALFLSTATILWLNMAVLRFYPAYAARNQESSFFGVIGLLKYLCLAAGAVLGLLAWAFGPEALVGSYRDMMGAGILVFLTYSLYEAGLAVLRAKRKPAAYSVSTTFNAMLRLPLAISLFVWWRMGIVGMLWSLTITYLVTHVLTVSRHVGRAHWRLDGAERNILREVLAYGIPIWATHILNFLITNSDRFLLKLLGDDAQVGLYSVSTNLVDQPMALVFQTFTMAVFPSVAAAWEMQGRASTEQLVEEVTRIFYLLCMPIMVFLSVLAKPTFLVLARGESWQAYSATFWVAAAAFCYGLSYFAAIGLHLAKRTGLLMLMTAVAWGANMVLNLGFIPLGGFVGAGAARMASNMLLVLAVALIGRRHFHWRTNTRSAMRIALAALAGAGFGYLCYRSLPLNLITLSLDYTVAFLGYGVALVLVREVPMHEIRAAWRRFRGGPDDTTGNGI